MCLDAGGDAAGSSGFHVGGGTHHCWRGRLRGSALGRPPLQLGPVRWGLGMVPMRLNPCLIRGLQAHMQVGGRCMDTTRVYPRNACPWLVSQQSKPLK